LLTEMVKVAVDGVTLVAVTLPIVGDKIKGSLLGGHPVNNTAIALTIVSVIAFLKKFFIF